MHHEHITDVGYDQEDSYFHQKDLELIARKRAELDRQRAAATGAAVAATASAAAKCPRCGAAMQEVTVAEHVKVDRCTGCGGVFLDRGELDILTHARSGSFFRRIFGSTHGDRHR